MADGTAKRMMASACATITRARIASSPALAGRRRTSRRQRPPKTLAEYIGQKKVKENIAIALKLPQSREALDHVLLYGPPAWENYARANHSQRAQRPHKTSAGPVLERKGDLTAILTSLELREVFSSTKFTACNLPSKKSCIRDGGFSR